MRTRCILRVVLVPLAVALSCLSYGETSPGTDVDSPSSPGSIGAAHEADPETGRQSDAASIPCTSVATTWPVVGTDPAKLTAPQLAVVRTDFRPKDVQLHLDGRFIGRARYFNGKNGYLFLEPGRYRLEVRLGGYRTELFEIDAKPNCRFDIRHRMMRSPETAKEDRTDFPGKGVPGQRVFSPVEERQLQSGGTRPGAPDLALRPDVSEQRSPATAIEPRTSSLVIKVEPVTASVYLDGALLATGEELALMVGPVAIPAGSHSIEVRAPGFASREIELEIGPGEREEITVSLQRIEAD